MANITYAVLAAAPILAWYLYLQLYRWRFNKFAYIPTYKPKSLLFGNLIDVDEATKKLDDPRRHFDYAAEIMFEEAGNPQMLFLDLRPVSTATLVIGSHELAEQISRSTKMHPQSVEKTPDTLPLFRSLLGDTSMIHRKGDEWKNLRRSFNPGFAPQHLTTLLPQILEKTSTFMSKLDNFATTGEVFEMELLCTNLTFDIIGEVVMNRDLCAQESSGKSGFVHDFCELVATYEDVGAIFSALNFRRQIKRSIYAWKSDTYLKREVKKQFDQIKAAQAGAEGKKDRSVLALAFKDTDVLTPELLNTTVDQLKSFLFAGHDTTSALLLRLIYELSLRPKCLATIRAEHDRIFGDMDPLEVFHTKPDETIKSLIYTSACIKEALRLWPPGASARSSPAGTGFKLRLENGEEICADGVSMYLCPYLIQRDPKAYGETAKDFNPERWIGNTNTSSTDDEDPSDQDNTSKIPVGAWRAFERGPRNCIGQELANLEARVIISCVIRRYDFTKIGAGEVDLDEKGNPVLNEKGVYKTKSEMFNHLCVTSKPFDKGMMKVRMRSAKADRKV